MTSRYLNVKLPASFIQSHIESSLSPLTDYQGEWVKGLGKH